MGTEKKQKSITVNLIANGIKTLMSVLFPLITFPYASRILGTSGIGKVSYASSIISYFSMFAALGISNYAVREGARIRDEKEKFNKFAKEMLNINLYTTFITYMAFLIFLSFPILKGYMKLLVISSMGIVFTTIGMEWLFIIEEEYSYITKRAILFQFISLGLLFLTVKSRDDYCWYAALTVISSGGSAVLNLWHSRKFVDWRQKGKLEYKKHLKPIFLIFGATMATNIYITMDTTMLGAIQGDDAVGIYTAAIKINSVVSTLLGTISSTILPRVSYYLGNGQKREYERLMKQSVDILFMIAIPAAIGMMCISDVSILLLSGEQFIEGNLAAKILSVKVVVGAINRILAYQICVPYKKDRDVLISTSCGAIFNLIANAILIPRFGVTGAAIATLFSEVVVFIALTCFANQVFKTKILYTRVIVYFMCSVWFFAIRYILNIVIKSNIMILIGTIVICIIGYFGILALIKDPYLKGIIRQLFERIGKIRSRKK